MDSFFPFIYAPKEKEVFEPLPLYIEPDFTPPPKIIIEEPDENRRGVIIIDL